MQENSARASRIGLRAASCLLLVLGFVLLVRSMDSAGTPGWDETGHCFSALRMGTAVSAGQVGVLFDEFHRPDFYTPLGRAGMAVGFLFDSGFGAPRVATALAWFLTIGLAGLLARGIAGPDAADAATFWTVLGGFGCYLGADYSRVAYTEAWSALSTVVAVHLYVRARASGKPLWALACGLSLGAAVLVKYTYALYIIGAVGLSGLWDLWKRPPGVRPGLLAAWCAAGMVGVLLWWFVLPLPKGFEIGRLHREAFAEYLTKAAILSSVGPWSLAIFWPFKACMSLLVFSLQVVGIGWGLRRWSDPAARLCAVLALVSAIGYAYYPFRIDRFLIPNLFGAWVLAGVVVARAQGRLAPRLRPLLGIALVAASWATIGWGAGLVVPLVPDIAEKARAKAIENIHAWNNPYRARQGPACGPPGTERVLDVVAERFEPHETFAWIGGTGTELPLYLLQWRLYQAHGDARSLYLKRREIDHLMQDDVLEAVNEEQFRVWTETFTQVGVLDPPDPKRPSPRPFELRFAAWMQQHPAFQAEVTVPVEIEVRPDEKRLFQVTIYRRRQRPGH